LIEAFKDRINAYFLYAEFSATLPGFHSKWDRKREFHRRTGYWSFLKYYREEVRGLDS